MKLSFEFQFEFSEVENVNLTSVLGCKSFYNPFLAALSSSEIVDLVESKLR